MYSREEQAIIDKTRQRRTLRIEGVENGFITQEGDTGRRKVFSDLSAVMILIEDFFREDKL